VTDDREPTHSSNDPTRPRGRKGRVAVFLWEGYLSVAPSLISGVRLLAADGYHVDIITRPPTNGEYALSPDFPTGVRILMESSRSDAKPAAQDGALERPSISKE